MPYSAGVVFLEVIPSFAGFQRAAEKAVKPLGTAVAKEVDSGLKDGADGADKQGAEAGKKYSGAFAKESSTRIKRALDALGTNIEVGVDDSDAKETIKEIRAQLKSLGDRTVDVDVDAKSAFAEIKKIEARLKALSDDDAIDIDVRMNTGAAKREIAALRAEASKAFGATSNELAEAAQINRIFDAQRRALEKTRNAEALAHRKAEAQADRENAAQSKAFERDRISALRALDREQVASANRRKAALAAEVKNAIEAQRLATLRASRTGTKEDVDTANGAILARYETETRAANEASDQRILAAHRASGAEVGDAHSTEIFRVESIHRIADENSRANRRDADEFRLAQNVKSRVARNAARENVSNASSGANAFRVFNGFLLTAVTLGPLLIPIIATLTAGVLALGTALLGAALGIGALFAGFAGIGTAVSALSAFDKEGRKVKHQGKAPAAADLRQVRDAQLAYARAQEDSGQRIASAVDSQQRAERSLAKAQDDARKAQVALSDARAAAVQRIIDLRDQLAGGKLDEQDAIYAVEEAAAHLNVVLEDNQSTSREKEKADLAYKQAQFRLSQIQKSNNQLAKDVDKANTAGIEGSDEVVAAKEQIVSANEAVADAEKAAANAASDVAQARIEENRTLADAQQRVVDAQQSMLDATLATGAQGTAAMDALNEAMGALSPTGQAFARFLYGLKPLLDDIRTAAQEGLLPGIQSGLQRLVDAYGPDIITFVGVLSKTLGDLFDAASKTFTAPFWQDFFKTFGEFAPKFIEQFFQVGMDVLTIIAGLAQAFAPFALEFGDAMVRMFDGIAEWSKTLSTNKGFQKFLDYIRDAGPKVFKLLELLGTIFVNLAIGLAPYADKLLDVLLTFAEWLAAMDPDDLAKLALGLAAVVASFQALAGLASIVTGLGGLLKFAAGIGPALAGVSGLLGIGGVADAAAGIPAAAAAGVGAEAAGGGALAAGGTVAAASGPVGWIVLAIAAAIAAIIGFGFWIDHLYKTNEEFKQRADTFAKEVGAIFAGLGQVFDTVFGPIDAFFRTILGPTILWFYTDIVAPVFGFIGDIFNIFWQVVSTAANIVSQLFLYVLYPIFHKFYDDHIKPVWENQIKPVFDALGNFISDHVAPAFQAGRDAIGRIWAGLIDLVKAPIEFVVNTVINGGIIDTFNKLVDNFPGMKKVDHVQLPASWNSGGGGTRDNRAPGFATGGVLPGYTPGRDVHRFVSPTGGRIDLSGGEGIAVPELVRAIGARRFLAANAAARSGQLGQAMRYIGGYADGGILGWLGSTTRSVSDTISGAVSSVGGLLSNPGGALKKIVDSLLGDGNTGFAGIAASMAHALVDGIAGSISNIFGADGSGATLPSGSAIGWQAMEAIVSKAFPGTAFTSAFRPGAITAVGTRSYHALGRAIDMTPSMALFNWLSANFPESRELFYSPAGPGSQILNGHKGANLAPVTVRDHYSHVHWAYDEGGIVPNLYDSGGYLPPGLSVVLNKTNQPEPVLTSQQFDQLGQSGGGGNNYFTGDVYGFDPKDIAEEWERQRHDRLVGSSLGAAGVTQ